MKLSQKDETVIKHLTLCTGTYTHSKSMNRHEYVCDAATLLLLDEWEPC